MGSFVRVVGGRSFLGLLKALGIGICLSNPIYCLVSYPNPVLCYHTRCPTGIPSPTTRTRVSIQVLSMCPERIFISDEDG
ncbi:hypothetical protein BELL_0031g00120 [Botrytis elliptica]|uniref:Uncharacterized protein n=1 Tax=Botrytis elliptica TaxID=278938 RepID=A0A4Z1K0Z0_9HELO|nr:hypothetical protein BELL_0031g00120 [Botrytis elliptica]